eukprot:UN3453
MGAKHLVDLFLGGVGLLPSMIAPISLRTIAESKRRDLRAQLRMAIATVCQSFNSSLIEAANKGSSEALITISRDQYAMIEEYKLVFDGKTVDELIFDAIKEVGFQSVGTFCSCNFSCNGGYSRHGPCNGFKRAGLVKGWTISWE